MAKKKDIISIDFKKGIDHLKEFDFKVSTGSLIFDIFLGGGFRSGVARFGAPPEHGKTAQCLIWANNWLHFHKENGEVFYYDTEGRMTYSKLKASGIIDNPYFEKGFNHVVHNIYEDIGEDVFNKVKNIEDKRLFFVFDSMETLICARDLDKNLTEDEKMATEATLTTRLVKRVSPYMQSRGHHLHVLSQMRGNFSTNPGSKKTKMGSDIHALKHASSLTGEIQQNYHGNQGNYIYEDPNAAASDRKVLGHYHIINFTKTYNDKSNETIRIPIKKGCGIWKERELADLSLMYGLANKGGAWFTVGEEKVQGYDNFLKLFENKDFANTIEKELRDTLLNNET